MACGHVRIFARTWTLGAFLIKSVVSPALIKTEHLRECLASRILALYALAPNHVLGQYLGCPAPVLATLRSALSAKVVKGELLRLCPGLPR